ncbi:MAG: prenyltransferase [Deltaproteobacteria bacterium]|nr:prenyltransferase [Deltaproteobacteria bacterium]
MIGVYLKALRAPFLAGSLVTVVVGSAYAFSLGAFSPALFGITLLGVGSLHLGANLLNDYYDARGSDPINVRLTPFSGGSRVIQEEKLSAYAVLLMALFFLAVGIASGIWLIVLKRPWVALFGGLGLFSGWVYSASPFQWMSKGLGEVVIFLAFGPLITLGTSYVMTNSVSWPAFAVGFPQGFLVAAIIWINEFPDFQADAEAGKRNLVVKLGLKASRYGYGVIMLCAFGSVIFLVGAVGMPYLIMMSFAALPLAFKAVKVLWTQYQSHEAIVPAQALTIQTVIASGLLVSLGLVLSRYMGR